MDKDWYTGNTCRSLIVLPLVTPVLFYYTSKALSYELFMNERPAYFCVLVDIVVDLRIFSVISFRSKKKTVMTGHCSVNRNSKNSTNKRADILS